MPIAGFRTVREDPAVRALTAIGNAWTRCLFDGSFYRSRTTTDLPAISLVFVQSRNRNTVADNPSALGGGETDRHLIYEGLSRVDADAVMAGAGTTRGDLPIEHGLMFQVPELRVFVVTRSSTASALRTRIREKPWVEIVDAGEPVSLARAMRHLRTRGVDVISAVGGRRTATGLLREGLVGELYLTTSPIDAGEPNTPFYEGPPLVLTTLLEKAGHGSEAGVRFEHFLVHT